MPDVALHRHIEAAPEKVWDLLFDIRRGPEWVTVMIETLSVSDDWIQKGSVYRERSKVGPSTSITEWAITAFDPPHLQVHETHERTLSVKLTMKVEPDGDGSMLIHRTEFKMLPVFRPLGWLVEQLFGKRTMSRELNQSVQNAKRLLESAS